MNIDKQLHFMNVLIIQRANIFMIQKYNLQVIKRLRVRGPAGVPGPDPDLPPEVLSGGGRGLLRVGRGGAQLGRGGHAAPLPQGLDLQRLHGAVQRDLRLAQQHPGGPCLVERRAFVWDT